MRVLWILPFLLCVVVISYSLGAAKGTLFQTWPGRGSKTDWSRFAYTQYVTDKQYLCNSVMLLASLHSFGSKADRVIMYPSFWDTDTVPDSKIMELLSKAQIDYEAKLVPIEIISKEHAEWTWANSYTKLLAFNQTQYDRVLNLDSDSNVLQSMDELFLLPRCPVAMPRAYWQDTPHQQLSAQMILLEPSSFEFARIEKAIADASEKVFDMDIVSKLYFDSALVLPHRGYDLLTRELRNATHSAYLGNELEAWDVDKVMTEAKFLHFSDWPRPKPWIVASESIVAQNQPDCMVLHEQESCLERDLWLGFYQEFAARRKKICGMDLIGGWESW